MSMEEINQVICRAVLDQEFRELLFSDLDTALEDYDLSDEERVGLRNIEREKFDDIASALEERMSRAGIGLQALGGRIKLSEQNLGKFNQSMHDFGGSEFMVLAVPVPE